MNVVFFVNFKLVSEMKIVLYFDFDEWNISLDDCEFLIIEVFFVQEVLMLKDIVEIVGIKIIMLVIKKMIDRCIVLSQEEFFICFMLKIVFFVEFFKSMVDDELFNFLLNELSGKKVVEKQEKVLMILFQQGGYVQGKIIFIFCKKLEEVGVFLLVLQIFEKNGVVEIKYFEILWLVKKDVIKLLFFVFFEYQ